MFFLIPTSTYSTSKTMERTKPAKASDNNYVPTSGLVFHPEANIQSIIAFVKFEKQYRDLNYFEQQEPIGATPTFTRNLGEIFPTLRYPSAVDCH